MDNIWVFGFFIIGFIGELIFRFNSWILENDKYIESYWHALMLVIGIFILFEKVRDSKKRLKRGKK